MQANEPSFDRIARVYRWAEYLALGPLLQQTRRAHLSHLAGCRRALLFGDGDGRFLAALLRRNLSLHATAIDTSAAMLRLLEARCRRDATAGRLTSLQGSALAATIPPGTDLVVTHFFLDCLTQAEVDQLITQLAAALHPGSLWLVSDFAIPRSVLLRGAARLYVRALYLAFRLLTGLRVHTLPDPQAVLVRCGFRRVARFSRLFGLLYSELWVLEPGRQPERHNPALPRHIHTPMAARTEAPTESANARRLPDAQPDPEPPVPSLSEPDPGLFQREPGFTNPQPGKPVSPHPAA